MDNRNAIKLLDDTFNNDFDINRYLKFVKEVFNKFDVTQSNRNVLPEYQNYIDSYQMLGSYRDKSKKVIDVLVVKLKKTSSRDRARTMQRNFVARYLGNVDREGALVAFHGDDPQDWRFSFVKIEYRLEKSEDGRTKTVKELTPAKRYSFLVGRNEPNHTCRKQFLDLILEEDIMPSFENIEEAFSIDNVTKEFFLEYKKLFLELMESLEKIIKKDYYVKKEFKEKNISTVDFAKKLLGQIVFIYFLQKKGWLGVKKDSKTGKFGEWGTGSKKFLRKLFDKEVIQYDNFFNDVLEPLFYEALATDRDEDYYSRFRCKIPFLNGGLFEPINNYGWTGTDIILDNYIFENIFNTFDRFNFTVKEDEPLDKEVAVDPEMLGKVFENLLEVRYRKSKGAFYTPREIVHYMCQQSVINYLKTNVDIPQKDIEKFIQLGDFALDVMINEQGQIKKFGRSYNINEKLKLPKSIKENYLKIDDSLKEIKIVDPACGSGAFLVGMMMEIVKARTILSTFFGEKEQSKRTDYNLKREVIENNIYGVDIDSSAVDIAKLRFWLSLIVDELDMKNIKPLPNLGHKIMCGNSLLEEFEGMKLFDEKLLGKQPKIYSAEVDNIEKEIEKLYKELGKIATGKKADNGRSKKINRDIKRLQKQKQKLLHGQNDKAPQTTLDQTLHRRIKESKIKLSELKKLQKRYFNEQNRKRKKELAENIDQLEWDLIEETLEERGNKSAMKKLKQYKKNKSKPFFLWKLYFAEVFQRDNAGFDLVIGNPPYVNVKQISSEEKKYFRKAYNVIGRQDLYIIFIERGLQLLKSNGIISFITSNKFLVAKNGTNLRKLILDTCIIETILDVSHCSVFKEVSVYPIVFVFQKEDYTKTRENNFLKVVQFSDENLNDILSHTNEMSQKRSQKSFYKSYEFIFDIHSSDEIRELLVKLKEKSMTLGKIANIKLGIIVGDQKKYVIPEERYRNLTSEEKKVHKKVIGGKNVNKCSITWTREYILYDKDKLVGASDDQIFNGSKLVIRDIALRPTASIDDSRYYCLQTLNVAKITHKNYNSKYVLGVFNSKLMEFFYSAQYGQVHISGGYMRYRKRYIKNFPIKRVSRQQQIPIIKLIDQILIIKKDKDYQNSSDEQAKVKKLENKIDKLVYKLYKLTPKEIEIIEKFNEKG